MICLSCYWFSSSETCLFDFDSDSDYVPPCCVEDLSFLDDTQENDSDD